jgi:hypothetical protein
LLVGAAASIAVLATLSPGCSIGEGTGAITGTLNVTDCWSGSFDMQPDFFAAVPYRNSLQLRIQNGGDFQTFSDGVSILIDDVTAIRPGPDSPGRYGEQLLVGLSPENTPPGVPIKVTPDPPIVHLVLYLQRSCRTQNAALYAMESVSLIAGTPFGCGPTPPGALLQCPSASATDGGVASFDAGSIDGGGAPSSGGVGQSTIQFTSLFNNDAEEVKANLRLNEGSFKVYLADPREICPGGVGPPPPCRGYLEGTFRFFFQRGRPGQPFP